MTETKSPFGVIASKQKPEPWKLCEVIRRSHSSTFAEWDTFWNAWFDENGNPIFDVWLWRYTLEN